MVLQVNFVLQLHPLQGLLGVQTAQGGDKAVAQGDGSHGEKFPPLGAISTSVAFSAMGGGERVGQSDDLAARPVEVGYDVIGGAGVPGIGDDQQAVLGWTSLSAVGRSLVEVVSRWTLSHICWSMKAR